LVIFFFFFFFFSFNRPAQGHFGEVVKATLKREVVVVKISRTKSLDERRVREARADLENECRILT
jgi:hypothetical protein